MRRAYTCPAVCVSTADGELYRNAHIDSPVACYPPPNAYQYVGLGSVLNSFYQLIAEYSFFPPSTAPRG